MPMLRELRGLPAPAKLNLFLHVTGRRPDGYHLLETVFQFVDLADRIDLVLDDSGAIRRLPIAGAAPGVPIDEDSDLTVRAAQALRKATGCQHGVSINLEKRIPIGAGLGGGSSDAATVLLGLNQLWDLGLSRSALIDIARTLGADVPIFIHGENAYATGIGDEFQSITLPTGWFLLLMPPVSVPTAGVFADPKLTRNTEPLTIEGFSRTAPGGTPDRALFSQLPGRNDLQPVVAGRQPAVAAALTTLEDALAGLRSDPKHGRIPATVRMTGSGACVFAALDDETFATALLARLRKCREAGGIPPSPAPSAGDRADRDAPEFCDVDVPNVGRAWLVKGLARHPLGSRQVG